MSTSPSIVLQKHCLVTSFCALGLSGLPIQSEPQDSSHTHAVSLDLRDPQTLCHSHQLQRTLGNSSLPA